MIIDDYITPTDLTGFVRQVPGLPTYVLNQVLPDVETESIEATIDTVTKINRAATFRSWDAETPIGQRGTLSRSRVRLPPISQKLMLGEYEQLLLEQLRTGGQSNAPLVTSIENDAITLTNAVRARMELARGDVLTDGKVTINENGLTLDADFGVDPSHLVTAATLWSDPAADPINDITDWVNTYNNDSGQDPGYAWISRRVMSALLRSEAIRQMVGTVNGVPGSVTAAQLQQILDERGLPQLRQYNTRIDVDGTTTRPIADNLFVMLPATPRDLGYTAWGITAEALSLASAGNAQLSLVDAPGLVAVNMKDGDPVRIWTKVSGVGLPIIEDPRLLMTATVL